VAWTKQERASVWNARKAKCIHERRVWIGQEIRNACLKISLVARCDNDFCGIASGCPDGCAVCDVSGPVVSELMVVERQVLGCVRGRNSLVARLRI